MSKPSRVIVLAEDRHQQTFVRRYLERIQYSSDQIQLEPLPGDRGSGEQWVRLRYAKNVAAYRSRASNAATALVVAIDADTGPVSRRIEQLHHALAEADSRPIRPNEKIAHLIPKRNIETWILCLNNRDVNEADDYRHEPGIGAQIKLAAQELFQWSRNNAEIPQHCVDSLRAAIPEIKRLE